MSFREFAVNEAPQGGALTGAGAAAPCVVPRRVGAGLSIPGSGAATAVSATFFTADAPWLGGNSEPTGPVFQVTGIRVRYETVGGSGAQVDIKKVPSGTAISGGVSVLAAPLALTANATTVQKANNYAGGLSATLANLQLAPGDSLAAVTSGTLTGLTSLNIDVELKRIITQH